MTTDMNYENLINNPDTFPAVTLDCLKKRVESGSPKLQKVMAKRMGPA